MILEILNIAGALALFLFGLYQMSNSLQKLLRDKIKVFIPLMEGGAAKQVLGGAGMTVSILTSRSTTDTIISLVAAGTLPLVNAVGAIMGANIGTTVTAWIITFFGFTINIASICFPILAAGFVLMMSKRPIIKNSGELFLGFSLLFLGISYTLNAMGVLDSHLHLGMKFMGMQSHGYLSVMIFTILGVALSAILQSSSAVVILTLIMCMNWLSFDLGCAMVLGANIGTTLSPTLLFPKRFNINLQAKQAAVVHFLFNCSVAVIVLIFFNPFTGLIKNVLQIGTGSSEIAALMPLYGICIFHTLFNLFGTIILIWFSKFIVKILDKMFKDWSKDEMSVFKYINAGPIGSSAIAIDQAIKEVKHFGEISYAGFGYVSKIIVENDSDKFERLKMKLVEQERISDKMEFGIADFLSKIASTEISLEDAEKVRILIRIIGELESLGDSCENIGRILERERVHNMTFDSDIIENMQTMISKVDEAYKVMNTNLALAAEGKLVDITNAYNAEDQINITRNNLRDIAINHIEARTGKYQSINYFLDFIAELEAMGDFIINVSQSAVKTID